MVFVPFLHRLLVWPIAMIKFVNKAIFFFSFIGKHSLIDSGPELETSHTNTPFTIELSLNDNKAIVN